MAVSLNRTIRAVGLAILLVALPGLAGAVEIKIATIAPENSSWMRNMRAGGAEIKERTEGRVVFKFFGGGVMGNDRRVLRKMRIGQLQGGAFTSSGIGERFPDIHIYGLPMLFHSLDEVDYVRERMDDYFVEGLADAGLITFGIAEGGFAKIMANDPVRNIEDLRGQKVWVPEGDITTYAAMEALELSPVVLPMTDVLTGLQTGLIDIVGTPPVGAIALQWHTKIRYVTDAPLIYTYAMLVIDKRAFDRIAPADQEIVREVLTKTYAGFNASTREENANAADALRANGIEFVAPEDGALDYWRGRAEAIHQAQADEGLFNEDTLNRVRTLLTEYRSETRQAAVER